MQSTCLYCKTTFDTSTRKDMGVSKRFCSYSHHNKYYREKRLSGIEDTAPLPDTPVSGEVVDSPVRKYDKTKISQQPNQSQPQQSSLGVKYDSSLHPDALRFIISLQEKELSKQSTEITKLETKLEAVTIERDNLKEEIKTVSKPGALEGLAESPFMKELMPHIGPALGNLLNGFVSGGGKSLGTNGVNGQQLSPETDQMLSNLVGWFIGLPIPQQKEFYTMIHGLAEKNPEDLAAMIKQLLNLVVNNASFNNHNKFYGAA